MKRLFAFLLIVGCAPRVAPPAPAAGGVSITIAPEADVFPGWQKGNARVVLKNNTDHAVLLLDVEAWTADGKALSRDLRVRFPATAKPGKVTVTGTYREDHLDPPYVARAPRPAHWNWAAGDGELVTAPLLPPGGRIDWLATFRATYEVKQLDAEVRYVPVLGRAVLRLRDSTVQKVTNPQPSSGWVDTQRASFTYRTVFDADPLEGPTSVDLIEGTTLTAFPYGQAASALGTSQIATARIPIAVDRLSYDIDAARAACKIVHGPFTYVPEAGTWVLRAEDQSCLASANESLTIPGDLIGLAELISDKGAVTMELFTRNSHPDPDGHVKYFRDIGLTAGATLQKGMVHSGTVQVRTSQLWTFVKALPKRKLVVAGSPPQFQESE